MNLKIYNSLQNAAVTPDGIELDFQGNECGRSYRIKQESTGSQRFWVCYFNDWRDGGWCRINSWPGIHKRDEALDLCNQHAEHNHLINFLPHRPRFKANWMSPPSGAMAGFAVASI